MFVVAAYLVGGVVGQRNLTDAEMGNGQSGTALSVFEKAFPYHNMEEVLVQSRSAGVAGPAVLHATVADLVGRLGRLRTVADIESPFPVKGAVARPGLRSYDGRSVLVTFELAGNSNQAQTNVAGPLAATAATAADHPQLLVEEFGSASAAKAVGSALNSDFAQAEHTSLPITLVILLVAFGALVAAGVPLLLGFTAVIATLGLVGVVSHLYPVAQGEIEPVVLLVGLAVGVDYSMFYLRRKLEERRAGRDGAGALARAAATSGRAVLISGLTVMTAMAGMLMAGSSIFVSFGIGTMLVVAVAVIGSVTVLPAVMASLGDRVEWGRVPVVARRRAAGHSPMWDGLVGGVLRWPWLSVVLAAGALLALAAPALSMRTVDPGLSSVPQNLPIMKVYDRIQAAFPGAPSSAVVVITSPDVTAPAVRRGVAGLAAAVESEHGQMGGPVVETVSPDRTVAIVTVSLAGNGTDHLSTSALATLRDNVIPGTIGRAPGTRAYVAGTTAESVDFNEAMASHLPIVFAFVLGMAFLLLLFSFRSIVVALVTIVLNLLSVGAAYGLMVLVFQDGYGRSLLGAQDIGGIVDWIPLFLLVILFGLSMDYHVLVLSRVREGRDSRLSSERAVAEGITATAGVITSAALVMVAVFSVFATLSVIEFKQLGVALAAAVFIDATVVRIVLLPSAMKLLGHRAWYLPGWLRFIDRRVLAEPLPVPALLPEKVPV
ncbi:MAG TPA: MMPL family transporter [Acidimicrobiales bacterium]|nr:MMPL family transporter [Acidimicrobiales bacterium]